MSRTRHTDKQKARIIREFEHHDGSAAAFCRQRGVSYQTLMNWRGRASANLPSLGSVRSSRLWGQSAHRDKSLWGHLWGQSAHRDKSGLTR